MYCKRAINFKNCGNVDTYGTFQKFNSTVVSPAWFLKIFKGP